MASIIGVNEIQHTNGTTAATIDSGGRLIGAKAGSIIQIQYDQFTGIDTQSITAKTDTTLDNLSVSITPTSTSSVIKLEAQLLWEYNNSASEYDHIFFFYRGTTKLGHAAAGSRNVGIAIGTAAYTAADASSTPQMLHMTFFDTPSTTSATTYKIGANFTNGNTFYFNRTVTNSDSHDHERGISFISATEIAG